jgi:hypothetical protein
MEISGSVDSTDIITRDGSGELMHGTEKDDGTVEPKNVDVPWEYEYEIDTTRSHFYSMEASNDSAGWTASGAIDKWIDDAGDCILQDAAASFLSTVEAGYAATNVTDGINREVLEVTDDQNLNLNAPIFPTEMRTYVIYDVNGVTISGSCTDDSQDYHLIDSGASFDSENISYHSLVENTSVGASSPDRFSLVESVNSATDITLDKDSFSTGDNYTIYTTVSIPSFSTTYIAGALRDEHYNIDFTDDFVEANDAVRNTGLDLYGTVAAGGVAANELTIVSVLGPEIFPVHPITYRIYKNRTLTLSIYLDDEEQQSITFKHWSTVEGSISGTLAASEDGE